MQITLIQNIIQITLIQENKYRGPEDHTVDSCLSTVASRCVRGSTILSALRSVSEKAGSPTFRGCLRVLGFGDAFSFTKPHCMHSQSRENSKRNYDNTSDQSGMVGQIPCHKGGPYPTMRRIWTKKMMVR